MKIRLLLLLAATLLLLSPIWGCSSGGGLYGPSLRGPQDVDYFDWHGQGGSLSRPIGPFEN